MSHWNKVGKFASSQSCSINGSIQKSGAGLGTLANMGKSNKDPWSSVKDKEYKTMSTVAYARKLQGEEDLRAQTKAFQVPISEIVKQLPKKSPWKTLYNEL